MGKACGLRLLLTVTLLLLSFYFKRIESHRINLQFYYFSQLISDYLFRKMRVFISIFHKIFTVRNYASIVDLPYYIIAKNVIVMILFSYECFLFFFFLHKSLTA